MVTALGRQCPGILGQQLLGHGCRRELPGHGMAGIDAFRRERGIPAESLQRCRETGRPGGNRHEHAATPAGQHVAHAGHVVAHYGNTRREGLDGDQRTALADAGQHQRVVGGQQARDGRLVPVPEGFVLMKPQNMRAMWKSPLLSLPGKLRLAWEPLAGVPAKVNQPGYDESVASFATRASSAPFDR